MITPIQPVNANVKAAQPIKPQAAKQVSFGKGYSEIVNDVLHLSGGFEKLSKSKPLQKFAQFLSTKNAFTHLLVMDSALISSTYMLRTAKNKKIPKDQKPAMLINDALVWGFSTTCTYLLDNKLNNLAEKTIDRFVKANKGSTHVMEHLDDYVKGIKNIKSLVVAGFIYRYVGPVIMTPIANKISKKVKEMKQAKADGQVNNNSTNIKKA